MNIMPTAYKKSVDVKTLLKISCKESAILMLSATVAVALMV